MNILLQLQLDHQFIREIFSQLDETTEKSVKTRQELFVRLYRFLDEHTSAEEAVLYSQLLSRGEKSKDDALEAFEEHHISKILLNELAELDVDDERWHAKLKVLQETIEHHIVHEEGRVFSDARKYFDTETLLTMRDKFLEYKELKKTHSKSLRLHSHRLDSNQYGDKTI